jgi:DeoR family transcriptional regulator of aga operon
VSEPGTRHEATTVGALPELHPAASGKRSRRMIEILAMVSQQESVSLTELCDALGVSAATMRRDLADLDYRRLIRRTHGGAAIIDSRAEIPVALRDTQFLEAKRSIATQTAILIPPERHAVALSGGSTTAQVARALSNHRDLTIITNSLTIATLVTSYPQLKVIMTGGSLRHQSLELVGILAENTFNAVNVGTAILGTDGITAEGGVTTHDETEARTNRAMVMHAQRTIVVADGSKIGTLAMAKVADIDRVYTLVTDERADPDALAAIERAGVTVRVTTISRYR